MRRGLLPPSQRKPGDSAPHGPSLPSLSSMLLDTFSNIDASFVNKCANLRLFSREAYRVVHPGIYTREAYRKVYNLRYTPGRHIGRYILGREP